LEIILYFPGIFMGWALGANDAANVFGTAVANSMVRFRTAAILSSIFITVGAILEGYRGIETISSISSQSLVSASISMLAAAISVTLMTRLGIPVSTSQAVVGSIIGIGLLRNDVNWGVLLKVFICWIATPIAAIGVGFLAYRVGSHFFRKIRSIQKQDMVLKVGAILFGIYGSYALGANNVANVSGVFGDILGPRMAALVGGLSISLGVASYSKRVMMTVGKKIIELDNFSAVVAVFSESLVVWLFALVGVPVSTSQAIVGGVVGAGMARGTAMVNKREVSRIIFGWLGTPAISCLVALPLYLILVR